MRKKTQVQFFEKTAVPEKKISVEKIFKIDIFVLKHVLDHSKSIPTKKLWWDALESFELFEIFWCLIGLF